MSAVAEQVRIRSLSELDIAGIVAIDERLSGVYRPDVWERRVMYYLRRDPDASQVAEMGNKVVGFMLSDLRGGEFGLEETSGWIERFGVDPDFQGRSLGRKLFEAVVQLLERVAIAQPAALVFEDLHWAVEMSLRLLAFASRRLPQCRLLCVATLTADLTGP